MNCRHTFAPYLPETELPELPETMNGLTSEQHYQATQQQQYMEHEIGKFKQEIILGQQAGLPMTQAGLKLGHKQRQLKAHTDHYKLPRNYLRERAWGVEKQPMRLTSAKWTMYRAEGLHRDIRVGRARALPKLKHEQGVLIDIDGTVVGYNVGGEHFVEVWSDVNPNRLTFYHTHPNEYGGTFSAVDIGTLTGGGSNEEALRGMVAEAQEATYEIGARSDADPKGLLNAYNRDAGKAANGAFTSCLHISTSA